MCVCVCVLFVKIGRVDGRDSSKGGNSLFEELGGRVFKQKILTGHRGATYPEITNPEGGVYWTTWQTYM